MASIKKHFRGGLGMGSNSSLPAVKETKLPTTRFPGASAPSSFLFAGCLVLQSVSALAELDLEYRGDELDLQPAVQVKEHRNRTVEEYRINGNLYMIKIKPRYGPAYYLVDDTGTGELEFRRDAAGRDMVIPKWTLMTW